MSVAIPVPTAGSPSRDESTSPPRRPPDIELSRQAVLSAGKQWFRSAWFTVLLASICFEGLGRRVLPFIPTIAFYFLKDVVLIVGLIRFRVRREVLGITRTLFGRYTPYLKLAIFWTFAELFNPQQLSLLLGLLSIRAYWFWWVAPLVVASVLLDPMVRRKAVYLLSGVAIVVSIFAFLQFGAPADDTLNTYAIVDGEAVRAVEIQSTGRVRVASTFSFITGFTDFSVLVPALLLSIGLGEKNRKARMWALVATIFSAASLPMSGSRGPFVISMALCAVVAWRAGLVFTQAGRRVILLGAAAGFAMVFAFPDALQGVMDRFGSEDTDSRFHQLTSLIPPYALMTEDYPVMGLGTGMMQSFRVQLGVPAGEFAPEVEFVRYMVELGTVGYLLVWVVRFGLVAVLWKSSKILTKAGRRAAAGAAVSYALLTFYGSITFDHTYAALYFVGFGFILQEVVQAWPLVYGPLAGGKGSKALSATRPLR